jgi:hypothetical protein
VFFIVLNKKVMVVIISAEPYFIRDYSENAPIFQTETAISDKTWSELSQWFNSYDRFTAMTLDELKPFWSDIDKLDEEGIELTKRVAIEWFPSDIEKFYYYSMCRDFTYVLYRDGTSRRLENPNRSVLK